MFVESRRTGSACFPEPDTKPDPRLAAMRAGRGDFSTLPRMATKTGFSASLLTLWYKVSKYLGELKRAVSDRMGRGGVFLPSSGFPLRGEISFVFVGRQHKVEIREQAVYGGGR